MFAAPKQFFRTNRFVDLMTKTQHGGAATQHGTALRCALRVLQGAHKDAVVSLSESSYSVGSGLASDIRLSDLGDIRLRIEKLGSGYRLNQWREGVDEAAHIDVNQADQLDAHHSGEASDAGWEVCLPAEHYERTVDATEQISNSSATSPSSVKLRDLVSELCDVYVIGDIGLEIVTFCEVCDTSPSARTAASKRGTATFAVGMCGFFLLTGLVYAFATKFSPMDASANAAKGKVALANSKFESVRTQTSIDGGVEFVGFVADERELNALKVWAKDNGLYAANFRTVRLDKFRDRLSESLSGTNVKIRRVGDNTLRVEGNVSSTAISDRLNAIIREMENAVQIENGLVVVSERSQIGVALVLPFKIATVKPGAPGYFETDSGSRYFEGSTTSEGYEVKRIDASSVRLLKAGQEYLQRLN